MQLNQPIDFAPVMEMPQTTEFEMPQSQKMRILRYFGQTPHAVDVINQITDFTRQSSRQFSALGNSLSESEPTIENDFLPEVLSATLTEHYIEQGRLRWQAYNFLQEKPENGQILEQGLVDFMETRTEEHEAAGIYHKELVDATKLHANNIVSELAEKPEFEFHAHDDEDAVQKPKTGFANALSLVTQVIGGKGLQVAEGPVMNMNVSPSQSSRGTAEKPLIENSKARILVGSLGALLEGAAIVTTYFGLAASDAGIKIPQIVADLVRGSFAVGAQIAESTGIFLIAALISKFKNASTPQEKIYIGTGIISSLAVFLGFSILDMVTGYSEASSIGLTHEVMKYILPTLGFFAPFAINIALGNIRVPNADNITRPSLNLPGRNPNTVQNPIITQLNGLIRQLPAAEQQVYRTRVNGAQGNPQQLQQILGEIQAKVQKP